MKEKIKDQIRENVYTMTDRFANTDFDLQSSQIREMNTVITELLFDLSLPLRKDTGLATSLTQSDVYKELYNLIETYQEKVDDGKSSDTEFDKLISSLQYNLEGLLSNHDVNPVVYLGESGNVEFSKALTQDDLENKLVDEVVVATEEQGGMNIQNPTSLKEAETNPRFFSQPMVL